MAQLLPLVDPPGIVFRMIAVSVWRQFPKVTPLSSAQSIIPTTTFCRTTARILLRIGLLMLLKRELFNCDKMSSREGSDPKLQVGVEPTFLFLISPNQVLPQPVSLEDASDGQRVICCCCCCAKHSLVGLFFMNLHPSIAIPFLFLIHIPKAKHPPTPTPPLHNPPPRTPPPPPPTHTH